MAGFRLDRDLRIGMKGAERGQPAPEVSTKPPQSQKKTSQHHNHHLCSPLRREREAVLDGELIRRHAARGFTGNADESGDRGSRMLCRLQRHRNRVLQLPGLGSLGSLPGSHAESGRRASSPSSTGVLSWSVAHLVLQLLSSTAAASSASSPATTASSPR